MSIFNNKWLALVLNILLVLLLFSIFAPEFNLLELINVLFYVSAVYLLLVLYLFIVRGRFFDGVMFSLRRFRYMMSRQKDHLNEWDKKALPSEKMNLNFYRFAQFQGLGLLLILIILIIMYYV